jgi:hypothetical protein
MKLRGPTQEQIAADRRARTPTRAQLNEPMDDGCKPPDLPSRPTPEVAPDVPDVEALLTALERIAKTVPYRLGISEHCDTCLRTIQRGAKIHPSCCADPCPGAIARAALEAWRARRSPGGR